MGSVATQRLSRMAYNARCSNLKKVVDKREQKLYSVFGKRIIWVEKIRLVNVLLLEVYHERSTYNRIA